MFVVKANCNNVRTCAKPLFAHNRYRPHRRELIIRRIDQARLEKFVIPTRTLPKRPINQPYKREEFLEFDKKLKVYNATLPKGRDKVYDIPRWAERIRRGKQHKIFRWAGREQGLPTVYDSHGVQGPTIRDQLEDFGPECFRTLAGATWARHEWTSANHIEVEVRDSNMEVPMPTHFLKITADKEDESGAPNLYTPIHASFIRSYWAKLGDLPEYTPMDICTPVDEDGKEMPDLEFARGELPVINIHVDNLESMPHIIAYMYQRNPTWFLQQIVGPGAAELDRYELKAMDWEQRRAEWGISKGLAYMYRKQTLFEHLEFLQDLNKNANDLAMDDSGFWWAVDTALRILLDAVVAKDRMDERDKNGTFDYDSSDSENSSAAFGDDMVVDFD